MAGMEKFDQLKNHYKQLVPSMSEESWNITSSVLTVRTLKKGEYLVREGEVCNHVSFINHGLVRMFHAVEGKEKIIMFAHENEYTAEYQSFLTRRPANAYLLAMEDTELVETCYDDLQMLYQCVPEANLLGRMIAENLFLMMCDLSNHEAKSTIAGRYERLITEIPWLTQRVPQYMIASYLGITPEAFSRIKSKAAKKRSTIPVNY